MAKTRQLGPVPYGNCAIRDTIGNTKIIISTDNLIGKTQADFQKIYDRTQEIYLNAERARFLREREKETENAS